MPSREEVIKGLEESVERAEALAARLGERDLECPTCEDGWTVKQVFAHLASMGASPSFFVAMAQRASSGSGGGVDAGIGGGFDIDAFNKQQVEMRQDRALGELVDEFRKGHGSGVAMLKSLPDDLLNKKMPDPFRGGMSTTLEMIQGSCGEHEAEHMNEIEAALADLPGADFD